MTDVLWLCFTFLYPNSFFSFLNMVRLCNLLFRSHRDNYSLSYLKSCSLLFLSPRKETFPVK